MLPLPFCLQAQLAEMAADQAGKDLQQAALAEQVQQLEQQNAELAAKAEAEAAERAAQAEELQRLQVLLLRVP